MARMSEIGSEEECSAPWEFSEGSFLVENDREGIERIFQEAREHHLFLTLVAEDGRVFSQSLLISLAGNILRIDKPLEWDETVGSFRIFLRSRNGRWSFFLVNEATVMPFSISVDLPGELFFLQRRTYPRVTMPQGTVAILKKDGKLLNSLYVRDISPAGMLVCTTSPSSGIDVSVLLSDIVISIPDGNGRRGRNFPPIDRGQVVRSFFEEENHTYCHGIAFDYESSYVREALGRIAGERD